MAISKKGSSKGFAGKYDTSTREGKEAFIQSKVSNYKEILKVINELKEAGEKATIGLVVKTIVDQWEHNVENKDEEEL